MWRLLGKLLLLGAARRWAKRPTAAVETAALVLVLNERRLGRGTKRDVLIRAAHVIFLPAAVIKTVRLVKRLTYGKRRGPSLGGPPLPLDPLTAAAAAAAGSGGPGPSEQGEAGEPDPLGAAAAVATPMPSFQHRPPAMPRPVPRPEWGLLQIPEVAPEYEAWVQVLRNVLAQQGLRSLPPGLDPDGLELTRYLLYCGLLAANKPPEAARAVACTAARITGTMDWRASYPFMTERELKDWDTVTWWSGPDEEGTLWLHLHLAQAMARCVRGEGRQCVQAIISQLEYGTRGLMQKDRGAAAAAVAATAATASAAAGGGGAGGAGASGALPVTSGSSSGAETPTSSLLSYATAPADSAAAGVEEEEEAGTATSAAAVVAAAATAAAAAAGLGRRRGGGGGASGTGSGAAGASRQGRGRAGGNGGGGGGGALAARGGNGGGRVDDRIRVVLSGAGSNVRQALRMFPVFREFIRLVQRHYPGRLRAMYLVEMPGGLRMSLGAVLNLLSQETRQKIKICKVEDLPDCIANALIAREAALQRSLRQQHQQEQLMQQQRRQQGGRRQQPHGPAAGLDPAATALDDSLGPIRLQGAAADPLDHASEHPVAAGTAASAAASLSSWVVALFTAWTHGSLLPSPSRPAGRGALSCGGGQGPAGPAAADVAGGGGGGVGGGGGDSAAATATLGWLAEPRRQLHELRMWLLRVVPALLMAAMACLTYKSLLARP